MWNRTWENSWLYVFVVVGREREGRREGFIFEILYFKGQAGDEMIVSTKTTLVEEEEEEKVKKEVEKGGKKKEGFLSLSSI